jgi:hypothetical protein
MASKMATITLYFDPVAYEREEGEPFSEDMLNDFGRDFNEQAAHFLGYSGWQAGWVTHDDHGFTQREFIEVDNDTTEG